MFFLLFFISSFFVLGRSSTKLRPTSNTIESDIRITPQQQQRVYGNTNGRGLGSIDLESVTQPWRLYYENDAWVVPVSLEEDDEYEGTNNISPERADQVWEELKAMEAKLGNNNVIRFVRLDGTNATRASEEFTFGYIRLGDYPPGCWSYIGRLPPLYQPQVVNIGTGCSFTDIIEHEMMHALGYYHEQARPDRDDHVTVHWNNIDEIKHTNFEIATGIDSRGVPYDTSSIMHYTSYAFALDPEFPTMSANDGESNLGGSFTMTDIDIMQIRMMYRCPGTMVPESYTSNCSPQCTCRLAEGMCSTDADCDGLLACNTGTSLCSIDNNNATENTTTGAPTTVPPTMTDVPSNAPTMVVNNTTDMSSPSIPVGVRDLVIALSVSFVILIGVFVYSYQSL